VPTEALRRQLVVLGLGHLAVFGACAPGAPEAPTPTSAAAAARASATIAALTSTVPPTRVPTSTAVPAARPVTPTPVTAEVVILDDLYSPGEITIRLGQTVTWQNSGQKVHDAVSLTDAWAPTLIQPGGRARVTFQRAGRFEYTCSVHSSMTGWVNVE
jgi:plastocyanin